MIVDKTESSHSRRLELITDFVLWREMRKNLQRSQQTTYKYCERDFIRIQIVVLLVEDKP
jgi:hypothetical protein